MTQSTSTTIVRITAIPRGGMLYASSDDIFGLNVVASSMEQLKQRLIIAVKWLYKQNQKADVEVHFPSAPAEFPAKPANEGISQLVISAAA